MTKNIITLSQLNSSIRKSIYNEFSETFWLIAEISDFKESKRGHAYLELIEKDEKTKKQKAKSRATIWSTTYRFLKPYFESATKQKIIAGIKVLINVTVDFHEIYGLSLNIIDIEPSYTIGDIERQKQEIIDRLNEEGIVNMNKEIDIPELCQKIAIISSSSAAGYGDFVHQLENNAFNYKFYLKLFPATMQGDKAEESIVNALEKIYEYEDFFDIVVIIRGGGSKSDLSCFDSYWISSNIAQFPLPVITGIGHERDESIADMVANTSLKTPTAVAEFLIEKINYLDEYLQEVKNKFFTNVKSLIVNKNHEITNFSNKTINIVKTKIYQNKIILNSLESKFTSNSKLFVKQKEVKLNDYQQELAFLSKKYFANRNKKINETNYKLDYVCSKFLLKQKHKIEVIENTLDYVNPMNVVKRGYSLTSHKGKIIKSMEMLETESIIETKLSCGTIVSKVIKLTNSDLRSSTY